MTDKKPAAKESRFVLSTGAGITIDRSQEEGEPFDIGDILDGIEDEDEQDVKNG